jgi:hypothetical protein
VEFTIKDSISGESNIIPCGDDRKVGRYLRIPLAARKIAKMKGCRNQLSKIHYKETKIVEFGLKITQIRAGKKFLLMAEFLLSHDCVSKTSLTKFDTYFRKFPNNKIGGIPGTKDTFYIHPKDGGFDVSISETDTIYVILPI